MLVANRIAGTVKTDTRSLFRIGLDFTDIDETTTPTKTQSFYSLTIDESDPIDIDWGDGTVDEGLIEKTSHTYDLTAGKVFEIKIRGGLTGIAGLSGARRWCGFLYNNTTNYPYCKYLDASKAYKLTSVGGGAFRGLNGLSEISFPFVTTIAASFYSSAPVVRLPSVTAIPSDIYFYMAGDLYIGGIGHTEETTTASNIFVSMSYADETTVHWVCDNIPAYDAANCTYLTKIDLSEAGGADTYAFKGCTGLKEITLPQIGYGDVEGVTTTVVSKTGRKFGFMYFADLNTRLQKLFFKGIGDLSFYQGILIRAATGSIDVASLFSECNVFVSSDCTSMLMSYYFANMFPNVNNELTLYSSSVIPVNPESAINKHTIIGSECIIRVPANLVDSYKADSYWSLYGDRIQAIVTE